ncbi:MAG: flagellin [Acetivibrio ethanolgignens]
MAVSGINNQVAASYEKLSSMKQINKAADNAAGLAIVNKMESQTNGYDVGTKNTQTGQDLLKTADGALESITNSLQKIREISVQAYNAVYAPEDKAALQNEVQSLKDGIQEVARNTEFNTLKLLDGSMADLNLAMNPDGTGMEIQMANATLDTLGIEDYDVTGNFDISKIDAALEKVTSARASLGASSNAMDSAINYNQLASQNLTAASSRIEALDVEKEVAKQKKNEILQQYQLFTQQAKQEEEKKKAGLLNFM